MELRSWSSPCERIRRIYGVKMDNSWFVIRGSWFEAMATRFSGFLDYNFREVISLDQLLHDVLKLTNAASLPVNVLDVNERTGPRATRFSGFLDDTNYVELLLRLHEVFSLGHRLHDVLGEVRRNGRAEAARPRGLQASSSRRRPRTPQQKTGEY